MSAFVFFDGGISLIVSLAEYAAMIILFAFIGHFAMKFIAITNKSHKENLS